MERASTSGRKDTHMHTISQTERKNQYEQLREYFNRHLNNMGQRIEASLPVLGQQRGPVSLNRLGWEKVLTIAERIYDQATFGTPGDHTTQVSVLVGTVLDACSALKKTPTTHIMAIGRALVQTAATMKDVLQEMKKLKHTSDHPNEPAGTSTGHEDDLHDKEDDGSKGDIGNDLSPEEMAVAKASTDVVSEALLIVKELIRSITGLLEIESSNSGAEFVISLEKLLKLCKEIGLQICELRARLGPPQEIPALFGASKKITSLLVHLENELRDIGGTSSAFLKCCRNLRSKVKYLEYEIGCSQVEQQLRSVGDSTESLF